MEQGQSSEHTGTRDETYDVISVIYHALQGAENCQIYAEDAEDADDGELRDFFQQACDQQRRLADQGKQLLMQCLQKDGGQSAQPMSGLTGGSAFGFGQGQQQGQTSDSSSETVTSGSGPTGTGIG
jgi:hypothetical protein